MQKHFLEHTNIRFHFLLLVFVSCCVLFVLFTSCNNKTPETVQEAAPPPPPPPPPEPEVKDSAKGLASYYGKAFDGEETAFGEIFDSKDLVAAHPKYPYGTIVRVTNMKTKDTVTVRVIDRGPTHVNRKEGVIIDLSRAAAAQINMIGAGRQKVKVEVLEWGNK